MGFSCLSHHWLRSPLIIRRMKNRALIYEVPTTMFRQIRCSTNEMRLLFFIRLFVSFLTRCFDRYSLVQRKVEVFSFCCLLLSSHQFTGALVIKRWRNLRQNVGLRSTMFWYIRFGGVVPL